MERFQVENQNEQLRKENSTLHQELHRLKKLSNNYKNLTDHHQSQLERAKTSIGNYKQVVLKALRKKDSLLKKYETILYGDALSEKGKVPHSTVIDVLKAEVKDISDENRVLNRERDFLKKEIEELESNMLVLEEKDSEWLLLRRSACGVGRSRGCCEHEFTVAERFVVGEFRGACVDVGVGSVFQRPDLLHVRDAGLADVCHPERSRPDALRLADTDRGEAPSWRPRVAGAVFRQFCKALSADFLHLPDRRAFADGICAGEIPVRAAARDD
jgi:FtsZ-binding cell division protein ZapB